MRGARTVAAYGAMPEEIDADPLIEALWDAGVRVALPRVVDRTNITLHWYDRGSKLCTGAFGLREPCPDSPIAKADEIDVFVVPGVAFDDTCHRLGMGTVNKRMGYRPQIPLCFSL